MKIIKFIVHPAIISLVSYYFIGITQTIIIGLLIISFSIYTHEF